MKRVEFNQYDLADPEHYGYGDGHDETGGNSYGEGGDENNETTKITELSVDYIQLNFGEAI